MDWTGAPGYMWLKALEYMANLLNHVWNSTINNIPLRLALGHTVDISAFLRFHFYQPVYYRNSCPSTLGVTSERGGRFSGISRHTGNDLCYTILDDETLKFHHTSTARPVTSADPNLQIDPIVGEDLGIPSHVQIFRQPTEFSMVG